MINQHLVTVRAPHYCASLIIRDDRVTEAAPILRWALGKPWRRVREHFLYKRYEVSVQPDPAVKT